MRPRPAHPQEKLIVPSPLGLGKTAERLQTWLHQKIFRIHGFVLSETSKPLSVQAISYNAEIKYEGKVHLFPIQELWIDKCATCGEEYFSSETDRQISRELQNHL